MTFFAYIRHYPFSVMALCNIIGDLCYLGFAFAAEGLVSIPKLAGALFTLAAHVILIAYADDKILEHINRRDYAGHILVWLRNRSVQIMEKLPANMLGAIRSKPIGIGFAMLSLNGLGLLIDAMMSSLSVANLSQIMLGACIMIGCAAFSLADYTTGQKMTNSLLKIAPTILMTATLSNLVLASSTHNVFMIVSCIVFLVANIAGFYTKIDKTVVAAE